MKNKYFIFIFLFPLWGLGGYAQEKDKSMTQANAEYAEKKFVEAEANYRVSQSKFNKRTVSQYNLGNSIYKQNQIEEAKYAYSKAIEKAKTKPQKHKVFHNLGNVFMKEKNYTAAVEAYKNALRNNPSDEETRYNFAFAKKKLKENPPKGDDKKDKKEDKKKEEDKKDDKKEDKKDKEKEDDKGKEKPENKGKPNEDKPQENGKPKPMPGGIPQQRVENLLDAVNNEEKKIQAKVNANKVKGRPVQSEKDW